MYLAARFCGIEPNRFRELAWWERRLIAEGLQAEQPHIYRAVMMNKAKDPLQSAFTKMPGYEPEDQEENDRFLASQGFSIRQVSMN